MGFWQEKRNWLAENWKGLAAVLLLGLLPFFSFLFSGKALFASDQISAPSWNWYFQELGRGAVPLWNPFGLGGMPTFDAGFGDGAYPVFLLVGMLLPIKTFIGYLFVLHVVIAGWCAYYLANRFFRLDVLLSVGLAAAYMLNTNFFSHVHAGHTGKFYILAWLPLSLYFLLRCLSGAARWYHALGLALTLAVFQLCNHPQLTYFTLMGFFLVWCFRMGTLLKEKRIGQAAWTAGRFWLPILLGIGLVFFLFYPPTQYTKLFGVRGSAEKTTYEHATSWSMHPEEVAALVVPEFTGLNEKYWGRNPFKLNSEYPGLSVLYLGLLGLVLFWRLKPRWFLLWGSLALMAIVFGVGAHTPLFRIFYAVIPGIKNFRAPGMMIFWLAMALWVMSADALSRLAGYRDAPTAEHRKKWSKRLLQVGLGLAGVLLLCGLAPGTAFGIWNSFFGAGGSMNQANQAGDASAFGLGAIRTAVLLAVLVLATWRWLLQETHVRAFALVLLAVTLTDLYWTDSKFVQVYDADRYLHREPAIEFLKSDASPFRVFGVPGAYDRWVMQYHGIETTDGWTDNEYRVYREYRGGDYTTNPNFMAGLEQKQDGSVGGNAFLDLLNVKYLAYKLPGEGMLRVAPNNTALPRAWFAAAWETLPDSQAMESMRAPGFAPDRSVLVSASTPMPEGFPAAAAPAVRDSASPPAPKAKVEQTGKSPNRLAYRVDNPERGLLFLSELYFPHWRARVDGKETPLLRADYAFRAVPLTAGNHTVILEYHSPWIRKGLAVSALSMVLLALALFAQRKFGDRKA